MGVKLERKPMETRAERLAWFKVELDKLKDIEPDNPLLEIFKDGVDRPVADFILANMESPVTKYMIQNPDIGLVSIIESGTKDGVIRKMEEHPSAIAKLIMLNISGPMADRYRAKAKKLSQTIDATGQDIFKHLVNAYPMVHYMEYLDNFHDFFMGRIDDEELISNIKASWLGATKSFSCKVLIVDDDKKTMFTHPGMMGKIDISGEAGNWNNFTRHSKENERMGPQFKAEFQEDYIDGFIQHSKNYDYDNNQEDKKRFEEICVYFDKLKQEENPEEFVEETIQPIEEPKKEVVKKPTSDWDLF